MHFAVCVPYKIKSMTSVVNAMLYQLNHKERHINCSIKDHKVSYRLSNTVECHIDLHSLSYH